MVKTTDYWRELGPASLAHEDLSIWVRISLNEIFEFYFSQILELLIFYILFNVKTCFKNCLILPVFGFRDTIPCIF